MKYHVISESENLPESASCVVDYTHNPLAQALVIPNAGLLEETHIQPQKFETQTNIIPYLYWLPSDQTFHLPFDVLSAAFFLATEYEKWAHPDYDSHGRYLESAYQVFQKKWYTYPLIHLYAEALWEKIHHFFPQLERRNRLFSFELTFDIDHPWKYLHKGLLLNVGGLVKDSLIPSRWGQVPERMKALWTGEDPNQVFELIERHTAPAWTRFFFLIDRTCSYDGRFTYTHLPYRLLIQGLQKQGYPVHLHPSYNSFLESEQLHKEKVEFEGIVVQPNDRSRQHFLRYRLPESYQALIQAGIRHDYSLCNYMTGGFRTGMAIPYPWFDLSQNSATDLILHPTLLMDVTLTQYLQLTPEAGMAYAQNLILQTQKVGGHFTLLLHNDTLSESGEWKGWRAPWLQLINQLAGSLY